jgi:hypothetical protein
MTLTHCRGEKSKVIIVMKMISQPAGFEPARGDPNGFQVHRLNHSATTAYIKCQVVVYIHLF